VDILKALRGSKGVVQILDNGVDSETKQHWMVLEACLYGDLMDNLIAVKRFSLSTAASFFYQMVRAVQEVHNGGFAHMDISLENFLVNQQMQVKVCDFGLAIQANADLSKENPRGKANYMAPEVASGDCKNPQKADVFSLGVALFAMVGGLFPFAVPCDSDRNFVVLMKEGPGKLQQCLGISRYFTPLLNDLLLKMLTLEDARYTIDQVAMHAFLQSSS